MLWKDEKISGIQAGMLLFSAAIGNIFIVLAVPAVKDAGRDGWLAVFVAYLLAAFTGWILINLGSRFPEESFVQYLPKVIGKTPGKIAGLYYILGWWLMTALILRETMELIRLFMNETPVLVTNIVFALLIVYAMKKGFEVYARMTEILMVILLFSLVISIVLIVKYIDFKEIQPVLANGIMPVIQAQRFLYPYAMETVLFMSLWLPCLNIKKNAKKALLSVFPISGILLAFVVFANIALFGMYITEVNIFPLLGLFRIIEIHEFLQGFDIIFMLIWVVSSFLELGVFFYQPVVGLAQWLNLTDYKALIVPMMLTCVALAMVPPSVVDVVLLDMIKNPVIILPLALLIPVTWLVAIIRKSGKQEKAG